MVIKKNLCEIFSGKNAQLTIRYLPVFLLVLVLVFSFFVSGDSIVTPTQINVVEDVSTLYNFTIFNNASLINITQVNFTFPGSFSYIDNTTTGLSNYTEVVSYNLSSNVLTFEDSSGDIIWNNSSVSFWFNLTAVDPGNYTLNIVTMDTDVVINTTSIIIIVNDTTSPSIVTYNNSISSNANYSGSVLLNATVTDNGNLNSVSFNVSNDSGQVNVYGASQVGNAWNYTLNSASLSDGIYAVSVIATDNAGNENSSTSVSNIVIDNTLPVIVYGLGTNSSGTISNVNSINVNTTITESYLSNVTFVLYNATGLVNSTTLGNGVRSILFAGLSDGNYTYNVTARDYVGHVNTSLTYTKVIDTIKPIINVTASTSSETAIEVSASTSTDSFSGVDISSCSISSGGSFASGLTATGLTCDTGYNLVINCSDYAGNYNVSSAISISTSTCPSSGRNGHSSSSVSNWVKDLKLNNSEVNLGQALKIVKKNYRILFDVSGLGHHVGITNVTSNSVSIEVASTPQLATLLLGETKKFDVDLNGYYDIAVKLVSLDGSEASVSIVMINEKTTSEPTPAPATTTTTPDVTNTAEPTTTTPDVTNTAEPTTEPTVDVSVKSSNIWLYVLGIIIIAIILAIVIFSLKNSSKRR